MKWNVRIGEIDKCMFYITHPHKPKMELNINRLKVLGEEELKRLDEKILQYQSSIEPTILTKSIDDIQRMIRDTNNIVVQLERELNTKTAKLTKLHEDLLKLQNRYTKSCEESDRLDVVLPSLQAEIDLKQVKFSEMDENIVRLKQNEKLLKEQLVDVESKLTVRTEQFVRERDDIQRQIRELEHKLKMSIQNSFTQHDEFVKQIKSIKLEPSIDDCQAIFDNIKMDLVLILSRNVEKYGKIINPVHPHDYETINTIHSKICIGGWSGNYCAVCSYKHHEKNKSNVIDIQQSVKWLETNYRVVLNKIITHTELKYIVNKLNYSQFKELFVKSNLFRLPLDINVTDHNGKVVRSYFNSYDFLLFILFIGTNGEFEFNWHSLK
jgi:hypothetical protein